MVSATRRPGRPRGAQQDPAQRRAALLSAAEDAIRHHGPDVSMEQLAERAGVSKATLYDNFDGKAGLTAALLDRYGTRLLRSFSGGLDRDLSARQVVRGGIEIFVRLIETDPEVYRFIVRNAEGDSVLGEIARPIAALVTSMVPAGRDAAARADVLAHASLGAIITSTERWSHHRTMSRRAFVDLLVGFVWAGMVDAGVPEGDEPVDLAAVARAIEAAGIEP